MECEASSLSSQRMKMRTNTEIRRNYREKEGRNDEKGSEFFEKFSYAISYLHIVLISCKDR